MMRLVAMVALIAAAACSPPAPPTDETPVPVEGVPSAAEAPAEVLAAIHADDATFAPSEATLDATTGAMTYQVKGAGAHGELTYNVMQFNEGWRVVQIRREMVWGDAPASVRNAVATSPTAVVPARVVEVREPGADGMQYELWGGSPETVLMTVRDVDGQAAIMPVPH